MSEPSDADAPEDLDALIARVDPDRWLSSRYVADPERRADMLAIYALDHELGRAPRVASNPLIGEIRLTWWREALDEVFGAAPVRRHPTALALHAAVARHDLPRERFEAMVDARYRELDPRPMSLDEALAWAADTGGASAALAAAILDPAADPSRAAAGGCAWSIGRLAATAGLDAAVARAPLEAALVQARGLSAEAFPAIAHATLSRPRLRGRRPGPLEARWRVFKAVALGRA